MPLEDVDAARAAARSAGRAGASSAQPTTTSARSTPTAAPTATSCARFRGRLRPPARRRRPPARRGRASRRCSSGPPAPARPSIPFGGGTSVVGGVEPASTRALRGRRHDRPAGARPRARGRPGLARGADPGRRDRPACSRSSSREHGLTLRHFPQSFEFSTLGRLDRHPRGRALRHAVHPHRRPRRVGPRAHAGRRVGVAAAARARARACSPDRMLLGSEGMLGVDHRGVGARAAAARGARARPRVRFPSFAAGAEAVRALSQSGLLPGQLPADRPARGAAHRRRRRVARAARARLRVAGVRRRAVAGAGAASAARDHGGAWDGAEGGDGRRRGHLARGVPARAVPARHVHRRWACCSETFETAITWDGSPASTRRSWARPREAVRRCGAGSVTCRFTHVYPDGPAPYFTILAPARRGDELEQWAEIKRAAARRVIAARRHDHPPPRGRAATTALV